MSEPRTVNNSTIPRRERLRRGPGPARGSKRLRRRRTEWDGIRAREVKPQFKAMGVTRCEGRLNEYCTPDNNLGFAHTLKTRHQETDADRRNVALLCNNCHDKLELMGEARMRRQIEKIIERRAYRLARQEAA